MVLATTTPFNPSAYGFDTAGSDLEAGLVWAKAIPLENTKSKITKMITKILNFI
jgi:hypothetical protein